MVNPRRASLAASSKPISTPPSSSVSTTSSAVADSVYIPKRTVTMTSSSSSVSQLAEAVVFVPSDLMLSPIESLSFDSIIDSHVSVEDMPPAVSVPTRSQSVWSAPISSSTANNVSITIGARKESKSSIADLSITPVMVAHSTSSVSPPSSSPRVLIQPRTVSKKMNPIDGATTESQQPTSVLHSNMISSPDAAVTAENESQQIQSNEGAFTNGFKSLSSVFQPTPAAQTLKSYRLQRSYHSLSQSVPLQFTSLVLIPPSDEFQEGLLHREGSTRSTTSLKHKPSQLSPDESCHGEKTGRWVKLPTSTQQTSTAYPTYCAT
ncbi:hypothetical protein BC830DRAFT_310603 [Chytriomyces sp. MP71]|nr:hypothetical protein BC830DRAFT_310603 [Chytriomyces sp. MP71]